jgi:hypothetical protein
VEPTGAAPGVPQRTVSPAAFQQVGAAIAAGAARSAAAQAAATMARARMGLLRYRGGMAPPAPCG